MPEVIWPFIEGDLQKLWELGNLSLPSPFPRPAVFDTASVVALSRTRHRWRMPIEEYLAGMVNITDAAVTGVAAADSTDGVSRRRIALVGTPPSYGQLEPQLAVDMVRGDEDRMIGCRVLLLPAVAKEPATLSLPGAEDTQVRPEYLLAQIPIAILAAERAGTLTSEFCVESRVPQVRELTGAVGAVMLQGSLG
jgi:hypothetical protein